jgi:hypothetical protein
VLLWTIQEEVEVMTLMTMVDLEPNEATFVALRQIAESVGIKDFRFERPPRFEIDPGEAKVQDIRDYNEPGDDGTFGGQRFPNVQMDIALEPGQPVAVRFLTDLEEVEPGLAHIYHMAHLDREQQVQGGLTLLAVRDLAAKG